jgi:hypothetical protein
MLLSFILLFLAGVVVDVLYTLLVSAIAAGQALASAIWQLLFTFLVIGATWSVVRSESVLDLTAYAAGGALGTWLVVRFNNGHPAGV